MKKYSALNYTVPPRNQGQTIEIAFAVTPDEIVRRTTDSSDGSVTYETADICELIGEFSPQNRTPSIPRDVWTAVDGDETTPAQLIAESESAASRQGDDMTSRIWILGASDPEMSAIEELLVACGERVTHAQVGGRRASASEAYSAYYVTQEGPADVWYLVECSVLTPAGAARVIIDHHRPGDPGFGVPPEGFLRASAVGQVVRELAELGLLPRACEVRPQTWYEVIESGPGYAGLVQGEWTDGRIHGVVTSDDVGDGPTVAVIPHALVMIAAADHCLAHAYAGHCPGVDPDVLMRWRVESRAKFQGRSVGEILADIETAKAALDDADDVVLWPIDSTVTCRGCGRRTSGDDWDYCECPKVADMRGTHVPELPETGTRYGIAYVADCLPGPDGRSKVVCSGPSEVILAFLQHFVPREGLINPYGDPARGFAGAYYPG